MPITHSTFLTGMGFYTEMVVLVVFHLPQILSPYAMQQPPDPAVVTVSEAQAPAQQQKNIFQVCMFTMLSG